MITASYQWPSFSNWICIWRSWRCDDDIGQFWCHYNSIYHLARFWLICLPSPEHFFSRILTHSLSVWVYFSRYVIGDDMMRFRPSFDCDWWCISADYHRPIISTSHWIYITHCAWFLFLRSINCLIVFCFFGKRLRTFCSAMQSSCGFDCVWGAVFEFLFSFLILSNWLYVIVWSVP